MIKDRATQVILLLSALVVTFLFWFIYFKEASTAHFSWVSYLPAINASLNTFTACLLCLGVWAIKIGKRETHIRLMISATITSGLFLISYLIYHHYQGDTKFLAQGFIRPIYFFILISHIILSVVMVPMVFMTLYHAARENFTTHKKIARITFPIWLYVSVTGVLIYIFLKTFN